jgi:hypothetical protein
MTGREGSPREFGEYSDSLALNARRGPAGNTKEHGLTRTLKLRTDARSSL